MISYLWAQDRNGVIGRDNQLPWRLPADLQYFKKTTMGHAIVMGRKTFESIGKPLPGRTNIILTRDSNYEAEGCLLVHSKAELLQWAEQNGEETFVTGGSELFELFKNEVRKLYVTKINESFEGDTHFPEWDWRNWQLVSESEGKTDEKNLHPHVFQVYERKK